MAALRAKLTEPGRMAEFLKTLKTTPADAEAQLPGIRCPALIIMGTEDPDFADPRAEGEAIAAAMPAGLGTVAMIEGAGHYSTPSTPDRDRRAGDPVSGKVRACLTRASPAPRPAGSTLMPSGAEQRGRGRRGGRAGR